MDVRASALKGAIFADLPGRCRSALKIVDYASQVLFGSSATMLFLSNLGQSALRGQDSHICRELMHHHANRMV